LQHSTSDYEYDLKLLEDIADDFVLFHGTNCIDLTEEMAMILQKPVSSLDLGRFADGEISVRLGTNVRGKHVYIVQSTSTPVHENLMELLLSIAAARRSSALKICAIIPYFGYCRSDKRKVNSRETIAASDISRLFEAVGVDQILTVDLHRGQVQGFFENANMESLESLRAILPILLEKDLFNPVICCISDTGVYRAKKLKALLEKEGILASIAFITTVSKASHTIEFQEMSSHHKISPTESNTEIIGQVKQRDVIIVDDMIDTGSRLVNAAKMAKQNGAFRVFVFATHGIFSDDALMRIDECDELDEVFVTNTIYPPRILLNNPSESLECDKLSYVSIGPILAEAIRRIQIRNSLSSMTNIDV